MVNSLLYLPALVGFSCEQCGLTGTLPTFMFVTYPGYLATATSPGGGDIGLQQQLVQATGCDWSRKTFTRGWASSWFAFPEAVSSSRVEGKLCPGLEGFGSLTTLNLGNNSITGVLCPPPPRLSSADLSFNSLGQTLWGKLAFQCALLAVIRDHNLYFHGWKFLRPPAQPCARLLLWHRLPRSGPSGLDRTWFNEDGLFSIGFLSVQGNPNLQMTVTVGSPAASNNTLLDLFLDGCLLAQTLTPYQLRLEIIPYFPGSYRSAVRRRSSVDCAGTGFIGAND